MQQTAENEARSALSEIRVLMKRSSRFLNVSPYAVIVVGSYALTAAWGIHRFTGGSWDLGGILSHATAGRLYLLAGIACTLIIVSLATALGICLYETHRKGERMVIDAAGRRLLWNLFMPLTVGGIFCLALAANGYYALTAAGMLLFYGTALTSASNHTFSSVRYLGYGESLLGLAAAFWPSYGLLLWGAGFGALNILYGVVFLLMPEKR